MQAATGRLTAAGPLATAAVHGDKMRNSLLISSLCLFVAAPAFAGEAATQPKRPPFLQPPEILKRMESSPTIYRIEKADGLPPGGAADLLWPRAVEPVRYPTVKETNGAARVVPLTVNAVALKLLDAGESAFRAGRYDAAARHYQKAIQADPNCYPCWLRLGDCKMKTGDDKAALADYEKAAALNPWDYSVHFSKGAALLRLGRFKEAREALAWALVLNPRHPATLDKLRAHARELGLGPRPSGLVIRSMARKAGKDVEILFDPSSGAHWLAFAGCKALWIGEPSHRKEMTGSTDHAFSSTEELECFAALLAIYAGERDAGRTKADPGLDRMLRIAEDKLFDVFVLYEITSRVDPQITLRLTKQQRELVRRYVLKYVLSVPDAP
jgi:tetratricopeptide (TPR) repeat protein